MHKRIISLMLAVLLAGGTAAMFSGCNQNEEKKETETVQSVDFKTADEVKDGAILQAFCWNFNTIKESMADIAAAGFSAVQTSPINECLVGEGGGMELYGNGKWYYHYQPTDFKIGNYQLGSRDEFKAMCDEAEKYGIKVIVDVIANHTTPSTGSVSEDLIKAGGGSLETLYHKNNDKDLRNFGERLDCTTYKMGGLPDINTERPSYQEYFLDFLNDCIACGADGFRHDTAKHIGLPDDPKEDDGFENNFWERVTKDINNADKMFIYGEVLQGTNDRLADYIKEIGRTTSSTYGGKIRSAVTGCDLDINNISDYCLGGAPLNMVTWVESHDNYINDGSWYQLSNEDVLLGWAVITARKDGTPLFFARPYNCSMENEWGMNRIGAQGDDMYKDSKVSAVNFFRTAMTGEDEALVNPNGDTTAVVVERGKKGAVIVNTGGELDVDFEINLADGTYVDRVDKKTEYVVKNGKVTCKTPVPEYSVVVLYNDGYTDYAPCAEVGVADGTEYIFDGDSYEITLTLKNAAKAEYSLNGGEPVSFKNGDKISVEPAENSKNVKLELRAENKQGVKTYERIELTSRKSYLIEEGTKVYFEKPEEWGDEIYAYVYDDYGFENYPWPGKEMKKEKDGKYCYTFETGFGTPYIIFNDGDFSDSVQYPEGQGLFVESDKTYTVE